MKGPPVIDSKLWMISVATLSMSGAFGQLNERVLHSFTGANDGQQPCAGLVQGTDGALYGTTFQGGAHDAGLIFKVQPDGSGNAPIWNFQKSPASPGGIANPSGLIQGVDGALYGTDGFGGTNSEGSVFRINRDGTGYTVLHSFSHSSGGPYEPTAAVTQGTDGMLYGTTQFGGAAGWGSLFKVNTNGAGYVTLHNFGAPNDGNQPQSPVIQGLDGQLYGTTTLGGASAIGGASGFGTIYKVSTNGTNYVILHDFMPSEGDGQYPYTAGLVQAKDGFLYGMTQQGGSTANGGGSGYGTIFKVKPDGTGFEIIHSFARTTDGAYPNSALVLGTDGVLYGTTEMGGANNQGVVFRLTMQGAGFRVLHHFGSGINDGSYPKAPLVQANDGGLFGTTAFGGEYGQGTVFRLAPGPPIISLQAMPDRTMRLSITAASNFTYRIEASPDHIHWTTLTNILNANGTVQFTDTGAASAPARFYRAAWVP